MSNRKPRFENRIKNLFVILVNFSSELSLIILKIWFSEVIRLMRLFDDFLSLSSFFMHLWWSQCVSIKQWQKFLFIIFLMVEGKLIIFWYYSILNCLTLESTCFAKSSWIYYFSIIFACGFLALCSFWVRIIIKF